MNPFSKRIHQIKNPDLDLPKGTRNPFLDLKSVFGFTERNTPLITVLTASLSVHFEKLWCSLRAFALVFSIVFYNRIMATCSPSQERQLVLMESMNRRLDSFLASQKKLEEKTQRFSKKTSSCELNSQNRRD